MSTYEDEIEGREFDWFAVDSDGNFALFASAGEGKLLKAHSRILNSMMIYQRDFKSPNWDSSQVW